MTRVQKKYVWMFVLVSLCVGIPSNSNLSARVTEEIDDSDLTGVERSHVRTSDPPESIYLSPDELRSQEVPGSRIKLKFSRPYFAAASQVARLPIRLRNLKSDEKRGGVSDPQGTAEFLDCGLPGEEWEATIALENRHFQISYSYEAYRVQFLVKCGTQNEVLFEKETQAGQAIGIWQIAETARSKLEAAVGLSFWKRQLIFRWPANSNYYSFGKVHLARGDYWDVVGHELGHGIYHMAQIGRSEGGFHKIDECYGQTLAFSEGWASYFSAWLSVELDDPDAKFEYLVPRRAPIRFETVPEDVCLGPKNEWRVTAFLWDLIDTHDDSEDIEDNFGRLWNALEGSRSRSINEAVGALIESGFSEEEIKTAWELNFKTAY